ncbi:hypothetical protein DASB73_013730 [Starmerella bacillaris]|uniref:Uncharacterized protein n=1 Tax=Starmerella bacillaris TaxID=1247836 RepID=A0AAV5RG95_STABA|nr:hypothetical protein DASB73_013730 [Starmerella bacillaris]
MSLKEKLNAARQLSHALKMWPDDSSKIYSSLRNSQLKIYGTEQPSQLPPARTMELRTTSALKLLENTYMLKFDTGDKLLHPDGNSHYYDLIAREAQKAAPKSSTLSALKNVVFGWWKR